MSTSSAKVNPCAVRPNSNLVSAMIMPFCRACSAALLYKAKLMSRSWRLNSGPTSRAISVNGIFSS